MTPERVITQDHLDLEEAGADETMPLVKRHKESVDKREVMILGSELIVSDLRYNSAIEF